MKKQTLKTKKYNWLAYDSESNFITDGNFAINASYLNFDNDLITDKIVKKNSFIKNNNGVDDTAKAPNIKNIIDFDAIQKQYRVINTNLMQTYYEGSKKQTKQYFQLFSNDRYSAIDLRLLDLLPDDLDLYMYAKGENSAHYVTTSEGELIALLMPLRFEGNDYLKVA